MHSCNNDDAVMEVGWDEARELGDVALLSAKLSLEAKGALPPVSLLLTAEGLGLVELDFRSPEAKRLSFMALKSLAREQGAVGAVTVTDAWTYAASGPAALELREMQEEHVSIDDVVAAAGGEEKKREAICVLVETKMRALLLVQTYDRVAGRPSVVFDGPPRELDTMTSPECGGQMFVLYEEGHKS